MALRVAALVALPTAAPATSATQTRVTSPKQALGFDIGDDYHLATYTQLEAYWARLARQSRRVVLQEIGKTAEGRPQLMAIVTSPENHKRLSRYKEIARRLALAGGLTDEQAQGLAAEGRAVVWIDGGLHATEVLGARRMECVPGYRRRSGAGDSVRRGEPGQGRETAAALAVCYPPRVTRVFG